MTKRVTVAGFGLLLALALIGCPPEQQLFCTGACCFTNGHCEELTPAACTSAGGTYLGDDSVCSPNPCSQPPPPDNSAAWEGTWAGTLSGPSAMTIDDQPQEPVDRSESFTIVFDDAARVSALLLIPPRSDHGGAPWPWPNPWPTPTIALDAGGNYRGEFYTHYDHTLEDGHLNTAAYELETAIAAFDATFDAMCCGQTRWADGTVTREFTLTLTPTGLRCDAVITFDYIQHRLLGPPPFPPSEVEHIIETYTASGELQRQ